MLKGDVYIHLISSAEAMLLWLVGCSEKREMDAKISTGVFTLENQLSKITKQSFKKDANTRTFYKKARFWNMWRWEEKMKMILKGWKGVIVMKEEYDHLKGEHDRLASTTVSQEEHNRLKEDLHHLARIVSQLTQKTPKWRI